MVFVITFFQNLWVTEPIFFSYILISSFYSVGSPCKIRVLFFDKKCILFPWNLPYDLGGMNKII